MPHALQVAILRNAARIVPASARAEWLAEWRAELWYVEHDATFFCFGSFRDALWLRLRSFSARRIFSLDSPVRCVLFLVSLVVLALLPLALLPCSSPAAFRAGGAREFAMNLCWMYLESLIVFVTVDPLRLCGYSANGHGPWHRVRVRRWAFLAAKIALLSPILCLATFFLASMFPPAPVLILPGLILAFRWALADQRQRCPVCLHFLSNAVEVGGPADMLFQPRGTELHCARGHGSLFVPDTPTSWCRSQRWQYMGVPSAGRPR